MRMTGGPVEYIRKLQAVVTVPSMEVEYVVCYLAVQVVV